MRFPLNAYLLAPLAAFAVSFLTLPHGGFAVKRDWWTIPGIARSM